MPSTSAAPKISAAAPGRSRWRAECDLGGAGPLTGRFRSRADRDNSGDAAAEIREAVLAAKAGDRDALRFLYLRYADNIYGYIQSLVHDEHEAEDLTQHVFIKLMTVLDRYEPREVPFAAWIIRVARNVAVDHLRARRQIPCEEVFGVEVSADAVHHSRRRSLTEALATLPEEQREVVVLRHLVGLTPGEIAERLGKTDASIHGLHHRARMALVGELVRLEASPSVAG